MVKIGITGNIACGKSAAFEIIKSEGFPIIDCDDIVKNLYIDNDFILETAKFFPQIITDNKINLEKLSDLLFYDNIFKREYESFIFPKVKEKITEFFKEHNNEEKVFVIVPLLFEAEFENMFDKIIFISSNETIREERLIARKTMLSNKANKVIKAQMDEEIKIKKSDYIIKNNGTLEEFKFAVTKILNNII